MTLARQWSAIAEHPAVMTDVRFKVWAGDTEVLIAIIAYTHCCCAHSLTQSLLAKDPVSRLADIRQGGKAVEGGQTPLISRGSPTSTTRRPRAATGPFSGGETTTFSWPARHDLLVLAI